VSDGLIRLPFADNKFPGEILLSYFSGFLLNPAFNPHVLYPAEIKHFHVVGISRGLVCRRRKICTWKIVAVTAQGNTFCFDTIQSCTSLGRQMKMFPILLAATLAGYFFLRDTHFGMNRLDKFVRQIVRVEFTIEAIKSAGSSQIFFVFHRSSLTDHVVKHSNANAIKSCGIM
jgi:hypothetical protein